MAALTICSTDGVSPLPILLSLMPIKMSSFNKSTKCGWLSKMVSISPNSGFLDQSACSNFNFRSLNSFMVCLELNYAINLQNIMGQNKIQQFCYQQFVTLWTDSS